MRRGRWVPGAVGEAVRRLEVGAVRSTAGEVGAGRLTGEVLDIMTRVPDMVNKMTGVDITNVSTLPTKYL